jgi:DNA-binding NarL/FixJ family response regulator
MTTPLFERGFGRCWKAEDGIQVVGEAQTGREAVRLTKKLLPAVVVMDIAMPLLNGLEATRQILKAVPAKVLILSAHSDDEYVDEVIRIGAAGISSNRRPPTFSRTRFGRPTRGKRSSIRSCPSASRIVSRARASALRAGARSNVVLTSREVEILQLIAEGKANKQSADELGISIKTVEKHRQNLMSKLGIHDTAGLTRYAIAAGIIESGVRSKPE